MHRPVFRGLVYDEHGRPVDVTFVGREPHYVVEDMGMKFHVPTVQVDRQILDVFRELMEGHEDYIVQETARMLGQDDPFTRAAIAARLKNLDEHFDELLKRGLPGDARLWLGMIGFRVTINFRGEVLRVHIPGAEDTPDPDAAPDADPEP